MKPSDGGTLVTGGSVMGAKVREAFDENGHGVERGGSRPLL
jgi:hypothetical protein